MARLSVLVIDASDWDREQIVGALRALSHPVRVLGESDLDSGRDRPDVIVMGFDDAVSFETARPHLERARALSPTVQLILCVPPGMDSLDKRVRELNARAFVLKPIEGNTLVELLDETLSHIALRKARKKRERSARKRIQADDVIGTSEEIREVLSLLDRVITSATTSVLLLGESGVGKSLFAQTIHDRCTGSNGPFVEINCGAVPPQLLESELFGYEPGAFTDARAQKIGLIELADGGTLFLDEITEMERVTQAKLLKFLDSHTLRRLGGEREISVTLRIVAATNRDIRAEVREGRFREDLYYRLNVVQITVPPLRERPGDIDAIAAYYIDRFRRQFGKPHLTLSVDARTLLHEYGWPGNVRELVNALERAALMCPADRIEPAHLPIERRQPIPHKHGIVLQRKSGALEIELPAGAVSFDAIERAVIEAMLKRTRGNVSRAAELLGMSRGALRNRIARHGIDVREFHGTPVHAG